MWISFLNVVVIFVQSLTFGIAITWKDTFKSEVHLYWHHIIASIAIGGITLNYSLSNLKYELNCTSYLSLLDYDITTLALSLQLKKSNRNKLGIIMIRRNWNTTAKHIGEHVGDERRHSKTNLQHAHLL
jgi:hypothetical protein